MAGIRGSLAIFLSSLLYVHLMGDHIRNVLLWSPANLKIYGL